MESILSREFNFENNALVWKNIYTQKLIEIKLPKLYEFNFKMLHNIVPNGKILSKWKQNVKAECEFCGKIETTKHMIVECSRVKQIWECISKCVKVDIKWKHILCGFPAYHVSTTINVLNYIICIIAYTILKVNSRCKFEKENYGQQILTLKLKSSAVYYKQMLKQYDCNIVKDSTFVRYSKLEYGEL